MFRRWITHVSLFAGGLAAIGASACCVGPLLLVILGVGGTWGSRLTALASLRPFFIAVSLASFMFGFHRVRLKSATCASGDACTAKAVRRQRIIFWTVTPLAVALMAFPLYSPLFY